MFKDILVQADNEDNREQRLTVAVGLAERFEAHLVGLYAFSRDWLVDYASVHVSNAILERVAAEERAIADKVEADFRARADDAGVKSEWRSHKDDPEVGLTLHARYADLVVIGQIDTRSVSGRRSGDVPSDVILGCGRPVLVVPYAGRFDHVGKRVVVCWNGSREAARAVHDALPLLIEAGTVSVHEVNLPDEGHLPGAEIATHLAHHGVNVVSQRAVAPDISVGDEILNTVADFSADLIVMGAYGHSRLRETMLGGVTRQILGQMTVPVLMST